MGGWLWGVNTYSLTCFIMCNSLMIVTRQSLKPLISWHVINAKKIMESPYGVLLHSFKDWVFGYRASTVCLCGSFEGPLNLLTPTLSDFCVVKLREWASGMCDSSCWKRWAESWHFSFPSTSTAAHASHLNSCHSHSVIDYKGLRVSISATCYLVCSTEFNTFGVF